MSDIRQRVRSERAPQPLVTQRARPAPTPSGRTDDRALIPSQRDSDENPVLRMLREQDVVADRLARMVSEWARVVRERR